jgi:hypothetical protein
MPILSLLKHPTHEPHKLHWPAVIASAAQHTPFHVTGRTEWAPDGCDAKLTVEPFLCTSHTKHGFHTWSPISKESHSCHDSSSCLQSFLCGFLANVIRTYALPLFNLTPSHQSFTRRILKDHAKIDIVVNPLINTKDLSILTKSRKAEDLLFPSRLVTVYTQKTSKAGNKSV